MFFISTLVEANNKQPNSKQDHLGLNPHPLLGAINFFFVRTDKKQNRSSENETESGPCNPVSPPKPVKGVMWQITQKLDWKHDECNKNSNS